MTTTRTSALRGISGRCKPRNKPTSLCLDSSMARVRSIIPASAKGKAGGIGRDGIRTATDDDRAVVVTFMVAPAPALTDVGPNVAEAPEGKPVAVRTTEPRNAPVSGAVVIANTADCPAATDCGGVELDTEKSTMAKFNGVDVPPPGAGLKIVTAKFPSVAMLEAGITAVICVPFMSVVTTATPFHFTTVPLTKLLPFRVKVKVG